MLDRNFPQSLFPFEPEGVIWYSSLLNRGRDIAKRSNVAICSLFRDSANSLPFFLPKIEELGSCFQSWYLLAYENDSADATLEILFNWLTEQKYTSRPHSLITEKLNAPRFGQVTTLERRSHMAYCRNQYMKCLQTDLPSLDYVIILDSDLKDWTNAGILSSIGIGDFDCVCSNCYSFTGTFGIIPHYYDCWALELYDSRLPYLPFKRGESILPVKSGHGGISIYRAPVLKDLAYQDYHCDHKTICDQMVERGNTKIFLNPNQLVIYDYPNGYQATNESPT